MKVRRLTLTTLVFLCVLAGGALFFDASAFARVTHVYNGQSFGPEGLGSGKFANPQGVAVDQSSGDVYVYDAGEGGRVYKFNAAGEPASYSTLGTNIIESVGGASNDENEIAVDNSDGPDKGDIYVANNSAVEIYSGSTGLKLGELGEEGEACGVAVDATGAVYIGFYQERKVKRYIPIENPVGNDDYTSSLSGLLVQNGAVCNIAADAGGDIYAAGYGGGVSRFEASQFNALEVAANGTPVDLDKGRTLAVDPSNGDVYIDEESDVVVYEGSGEPSQIETLGEAGPGSLSDSFGVAVRSGADGDVYVADGQGEGSDNSGRVEIFAPGVVLPDVGLSPTSDEHAGSVTLNGTVDTDDGGEATCLFEYGTSASYGQIAPCSNAVPSGGSPVAVEARVTGLESGTSYYFRLIASNANGSAQSKGTEFTTSGPGISESISNVASTSATLKAQINPNGHDTRYHFQYGPTASCPSGECSIPVPDVDIGSGDGDEEVSQHVQNLQAGAVGHYRLVAVSEVSPGEFETFDGPDQTFTTQTEGGEFVLPDGRGWELVSPPNKHGGVIEPIGELGVVQAAEDGSAVTYTAVQPITADPLGNLYVGAQIVSARGEGDWSSQDIATPNEEVTKFVVGGAPVAYRLFSANLSFGLLEPLGEAPLPSGAGGPPRGETIYLRNDDDSTCETTPATCYLPVAKDSGTNEFVGATPDLSHVVTHAEAGLDPSYPGVGSLYEWAEGRPRLVGVLPDGTPVTANATLGQDENVRHAISDDGLRVIWSEPDSNGHLYLRDMTKDETVELDKAQGVAEPATAEPLFQTASENGSEVFFTDDQKLTSDSTAETGEPDLYAYNVEAPEGRRLTDLTADERVGEHAHVQGILPGAGEDGSYVYFVAHGVLSPVENTEKEKAVAGAENLYVEHDGGGGWEEPRLVAVLSSEDESDWGDGRPDGLGGLTSRVSPDGGYLAFMSDRPLTGYDNVDASSGVRDEEVFLYDASAERVLCASCDPTGARPTGLFDSGEAPRPLVDEPAVWPGRWLAGSIPGWTLNNADSALYQSRYLSNSGRLFFDSSDALVPQDVNGKEDVYEYEPGGVGSCQGSGHGQSSSDVFRESADGCVALISAGASSEESVFLDASVSGDDVFFLTSSRLLPQDVDTALDVYDAHVCSEAEPCSTAAVSPPPCSTAESCRAAPSPQPAIFGTPSSATFIGAGNSVQPVVNATAKKKTKTKSKKIKKHKSRKDKKHRSKARKSARRHEKTKKSSLVTRRGR